MEPRRCINHRADMNQINQRKPQRFPLDKLPHDAVVMVRSQSSVQPVHQIRDISDSGISFYVDDALDVSARITIEYSDHSMKIEVYGRVAWCSRRTELPGFATGIELLSPMMLYAVLRKHADPQPGDIAAKPRFSSSRSTDV